MVGFHPLRCHCCCFSIPQRVVLSIFLHLALETGYNLRQVLNVAIVTMINRTGTNSSLEQDPCPMYQSEPVKNIVGGTYSWPHEVEMLLLYAFYIGYFISHLPGGWLSDYYGGRYVCGISILLSAIVTAMFPEAVMRTGYGTAVFLRTMLGVAQGPIMPAISSMINEWIPESERASLGAIAYSGAPLGTVIGNLFSGLLIGKSNSWVFAFYFWSALAIVWFVFYMFYSYSSPDSHPYIDDKEKEYIKTFITKKHKLPVPWIPILVNLPFWANCVGHVGHNYIFYIMVTCLPKFMNEVLHFRIETNAAFSAMPFFFMWLACMGWGQVANIAYTRGWMSAVFSRKFFGITSNVGGAACCLTAVFIGCNRTLVILLYVIALIFKAMFYCSLTVNINDLSIYFGGTMFAIANALGALAGVVGNALVGVFTKHDRSINGWRNVFWVQFAWAIISSLMFLIWGSAERQQFDLDMDKATTEE